MKRLICVLLIASLALSLIACGETKLDEKESDTAAEKTEKVEDTSDSLPADTTDTESASTDQITDVFSDTSEITDTQQVGYDTEPQPQTTPTGNDIPAGTSDDSYIGRITFLGDSTTYGMKYYGIVPDTQVWTPSNGTLAIFRATTDYIYDPVTGGEYTLSQMCASYTPDILVITLGVNGIASLKKEGFKMEYAKVINTVKEASPSTKIVLQTMYPLSASYDTSTGIDNSKINEGNTWISEVAAENGVQFLNSASVLVDETGFRPEAWHNGDGMHLSEAGFNAVMEYIRTHPCY